VPLGIPVDPPSSAGTPSYEELREENASLRTTVAEQEGLIEKLTAEIAKLRVRLNMNSRSSSKPFRMAQIPQTMGSEVAQLDSIRQSVADQRRGRLGDDHLATVRHRRDPGSPVNIQAHYPAAFEHAGIPHMHTDPDSHLTALRQDATSSCRCTVTAASAAARGVSKTAKKASPAVSTTRPPDAASALRMIGQHSAVGSVSDTGEDLGRALDVGEEKGERGYKRSLDRRWLLPYLGRASGEDAERQASRANTAP
jgi:hypothetical protein